MLGPTSSASSLSRQLPVYFRFHARRLTQETGYCICSNLLALVPDGEQPRSRIVGPKLSYMDERIAAIDLVISKLVRSPYSLSLPSDPCLGV